MFRFNAVNGLPLAAGVCLSLCVACGGSSSDSKPSTSSAGGGASGTGFMSSVPGDKPLNTLTDDEVQQLCKEFQSDFGPGTPAASAVVELDCRLAGILASALSQPQTDAAAQASCKSTYDACIGAPTTSETATCNKPDPSCTATVAEEEKCLQDSLAAFDSVKDLLPSCSAITTSTGLQSLALSGAATQTPASCTALQAKCPGIELPTGSSGAGT